MTALRLFTCAVLASLALSAQPSLTTIRDTVYRADGTPFNGIVTIEWRSFQTSGQTNVGMQSTTVRLVSGALFVRLAPTTASSGNYYLVRYNSNGQFQFSEIWAVPPTAAVLRLRDVRATLLPGGVVVPGSGSGGGLIIGETGSDGFRDGETPSGSVNGSNGTFTLTAAPSPASSLSLYRNGLLQSAGSDYTLNGSTITFVTGAIPQTGDLLRAFYRAGAITGSTTAHPLLSVGHNDTSATAPTRGALIVGQGTTPAWSSLALGTANRCLVSNGTDAVWNTCLFTGFNAGTIAFTGTGGLLSQDASLLWNSADRRMTVGNTLINRATLYVYDQRPAAVTELLVRSGSAQGATPIQQWMASNGDAVAWVNADGGFNVRRILTGSTNVRAAISDTGTTADPASGGASNGDIWFNRTTATWKSREAGQVHTGPQIICAANGTSANTSSTLGTCTIPANLLLNGDRLVIEAQFTRTVGSGVFIGDIVMGSTVLASASQQPSDASAGLRVSFSVGATQANWFWQAIRSTGIAGTSGSVAHTPGSSFQLRFVGTPVLGSHTVQLDNFTVTRYPAQTNP
jgi:hypothetical protein